MLFCPKPPPKRLTITPYAIKSAKLKFLLAAQDRGKGLILAKTFKEPNDFVSLPVPLVVDITWTQDFDAADQLNTVLKK